MLFYVLFFNKMNLYATRNATRNFFHIKISYIALNGNFEIIDGTVESDFFKRYDTLKIFHCWDTVSWIPSIYASGIIIPTKDQNFSMVIFIKEDLYFGKINHNNQTTEWHTLSPG